MGDASFAKCPNCDAPFPVVTRVESLVEDMKVPSDLVIRYTCYRCGAHVDGTLKLGDLAELRRRSS